MQQDILNQAIPFDTWVISETIFTSSSAIAEKLRSRVG